MKRNVEPMKKEWMKMIREMQNDGYAVIVWTPDELMDASPGWVEERSIAYGYEYLIKENENA